MGLSIFVVFALVNVCVLLALAAARYVVLGITRLAFIEHLAVNAQAVGTRPRGTILCIHILFLAARIQCGGQPIGAM